MSKQRDTVGNRLPPPNATLRFESNESLNETPTFAHCVLSAIQGHPDMHNQAQIHPHYAKLATQTRPIKYNQGLRPSNVQNGGQAGSNIVYAPTPPPARSSYELGDTVIEASRTHETPAEYPRKMACKVGIANFVGGGPCMRERAHFRFAL
jgi:hypothetical protein